MWSGVCAHACARESRQRSANCSTSTPSRCSRLLGIATNTIRNLTRKARREQNLWARLSPREQVPDFADELVGRIDDAGTLASVREAMRNLRRAEREVVALCVWVGSTTRAPPRPWASRSGLYGRASPGRGES
jgi:hypothetical protein